VLEVFFCSEAAILSGEATIKILAREKKPSGCSSYKPHFHAVLKPNISPHWFFAGSVCFRNQLSAPQVQQRMKRRKISRKMRKSKTSMEWGCPGL